MSIGSNINKYRELRHMTQEELGSYLHLSRQTISRYETGIIGNIPSDKISRIAEVLNVSPGDIMGWTDSAVPAVGTPLTDISLTEFPIIGTIAAGYNGLAREEYTGDYAHFSVSDPDEYFVLRVSGNSMYPKLIDGDVVLVRRCSVVDSGKTAVILYNSDEATVKQVVCTAVGIDLVPTNPEYEIRHLSGAELNEYRILGEVVKLQRDIS